METIVCPACANERFEVLTSKDRYRMGIQTVGCTRCGLIYSNPRPTERAMRDFYEQSYRELYQSVTMPSLDYVRHYHKDERANDLAAFLASSLPDAAFGRIADVGCAEGSLLRVLKDRRPNAELFGVEVNPSFAAFAAEHTGAAIVADPALLPEGSLDLLVLNHVLEHVDDPIGYVRELGSRLVDGGVLFVGVPDAAAYTSVADFHIAHLYHFTRTSLTNVVAGAGLHVDRIESYRPPHHPPSIRCLATRQSAAAEAALHTDRDGWDRVRAAANDAFLFHLRRHPFVRRILDAVRR